MAVLAGCGADGERDDTQQPPALQVEFRHEGLEGRTVMRVREAGSRLLVASDDGLFSKESGQDSWELKGLAGYRIQDLAVVDHRHWLAAAYGGPGRFENFALFETVNAGANWLQVESDFGGEFGYESPMGALHFDSPTGLLYATGPGGLAVSADLGREWELLAGGWDTFALPFAALNVNPSNRHIWYGGQNAIEEMILRRYEPASGQTRQFPTLLPSPSVIKGITFDPAQSQRVLVSGEGGILQSWNNGESWTGLLSDVDYRFYFQTVLNPADSGVIYTAGWTKTEEPQPLILEVSSDYGASWVEFEYSAADFFGGAWSIHITVEDEQPVLYIGLFRGGIMKVLLSS